MTQKLQAPVLVVGQGLAGTLLAWELDARGIPFAVADDDHATAASLVAAGLINPVTGARLALSAEYAAHFDAARTAYEAMSAAFGERLLEPLIQYRLFDNDEEIAAYERKRTKGEGDRFFSGPVAPGEIPGARDEKGGVEIRGTWRCDVPRVLGLARKWLRETGRLVEKAVDHAAMTPSTEGPVAWNCVNWRAVVFCEGHRVSANPWFGDLPMQCAKGETLTVRFSRPPPAALYNRGSWLLPVDGGRLWKTGATYEWNQLDNVPTANARAVLLQRMPVRPRESDTIERQEAGVRAITRDRKPVCLRHGRFPGLLCINGLGSKGSLIAPAMARIAADRIESGT